jgi:hypothetical protein
VLNVHVWFCSILRSKNTERLSGEGIWLKGVSGRQAGGGSSTFAGQKMDEWGWASVLMWTSWPLRFPAEHTAMATAHSFPRMPAWAHNLVDCWMLCRVCNIAFCAISNAVGRNVEMLFLICHSAPALSVALWVCSFIKQQQFLLAMLWLTLVPPGFGAVTLFDGGGTLQLQLTGG